MIARLTCVTGISAVVVFRDHRAAVALWGVGFMVPAMDDARVALDNLDAVIAWGQVSEASFRGEVSDGWTQGRALFGGVVTGGALNAMRGLVDAGRRLRSVQTSFLRPVAAGELQCEVEVLREGRGVTFTHATVVQSGKPCARVTAVYGAERTCNAPRFVVAKPDAPEPESVEKPAVNPNLSPNFTSFFDSRWVQGSVPFSGGDGARLLGWWKLRTPAERGSEGAAVAMLDAWPAPALESVRTPAPASSVTWMADFCDDVALDDSSLLNDWLLFDGRTQFTDNGFSSFNAMVWTRDGRLVANTRQLVAVF